MYPKPQIIELDSQLKFKTKTAGYKTKRQKMAEEQDEATKVAARQFMSDLVGSGEEAVTMNGPDVDMAAWKATYQKASPATDDDDDSAARKQKMMMETFWAEYYHPNSTSLWSMVYDEADSNEALDDTIEIAKDFMRQTESIKDHCFGILHTLETLEIEGLWFFNGPNPERLFGANSESSWFTWSQLGPEANELVRNAVASLMAPTEGKLKGRVIKDTQVFC